LVLGNLTVRTKLLSAFAFLAAGTPALAADIGTPPPAVVKLDLQMVLRGLNYRF
jgi:hypothetical protein